MEMEKRKSCSCLRDCPCYPNCDQMMQDGQMPGAIPPEWLRGSKEQALNAGAHWRQDAQEEWERVMSRTGGYTAVRQPGAAENAWMPGNMRMPENEQMPGNARMPKNEQMPGNTRMPKKVRTPEEEDARDWQKLKEMYPDMAKIILVEVEAICDSMEYEGSAMFDSIPDRERMHRLTEDIYEKVKDRCLMEKNTDQDDLFAMDQEGRRRYPPSQNWLSDQIQVLLYQEMFQRRCRHRNCRRW